LVQVATTLSQAEALGVARIEEAITLRENGISQPIVVMKGFMTADELQQMVEYRLDAVLHTPSQIDLLEQASLTVRPEEVREEPSQRVAVWIKLDTGMHRLGFPPAAIAEVQRRLQGCAHVQKPLRYMTHFANADDLSSPVTEQQINVFMQTVCKEDAPKSLANSAAIMRWPQTHADWVRPGIMLYGASPFLDTVGSKLGLQPVMTLVSCIIAVQNLRQGDQVGYGGRWTCPEDMPVALVAIGYGDGYPRHARNGTPVLVNGIRCALIGRVSMDLITVDLRNCPHAKLGDRVVLWGEGLPVEEVAECAETIAYEILCHVTARVEFQYI
jgi:alanine racemase